MTCWSRSSRSRPAGQACLIAMLTLAASLLSARADAQSGAITGTVTQSGGGAPIAGAVVRATFLDQSANVSTTTDGSGAYTLMNLPAGSYFVYTASTTGHVNETYGGVACTGICQSTHITTGTPVVVAPGATTAGIDLALDLGGSISGRLTSAGDGAAVANTTVIAYTRAGTSTIQVGTATTNASGDYALGGLSTGTYYVMTVSAHSAGFVNEIYDDIPCVGTCLSANAVATGTQVPVALGQETPNIDFALDVGGRVSGTVTDVATGAGIQSVQVVLYTVTNGSIAYAGGASTDATGAYSIGGLATGTYYAFTQTFAGHMNEIYGNLLCPVFCSSAVATSSGTPIAVTLGATTAGRDFALSVGGSVSGTVTHAVTAAPVVGRTVTVVAVSNGAFHSSSASTNASGVYTVRGLPGGTYYAYTSGGSGLIDEIYGDVACYGFCFVSDVVSRGTPIAVTTGATTSGRDFALSPGGGISGSFTDAVTGQPIAGRVSVTLYAVTGSTLTYAGNRESTLGGYSFGGLVPGEYVLITSNNVGYIDELYNDIPCWRGNCTYATGTRVAVTAGGITSGRNFALAPAGTISGTVGESGGGAPLPGVTVQVYVRGGSTSGYFAGSVTTNAAGGYTVRGLPPGNYVAFTSNAPAHVNEIYDDIPCPTSCSSGTAIGTGTPIAVAGATIGIDFALAPRTGPPGAPSNLRASSSGAFGMQFTWSAPSLAAGGAATSYVLEAGVSPGTTVLSIPVSGTSYVASGVPPGTYYVRVRGVNTAGTGPASSEVVVRMTGSGAAPVEAPTNVTAFMSGGLLTLTWADPTTGGTPTGYVVEAGSASGAANIASVPVTSRSFTFEPVPNGYYFLRVRARNAAGVGPASVEQMIVVGGVASPPGPPTFNAVSVVGASVTLYWSAPPQGAPTSYRIEAGSAPGLSNLAVANTGTPATSVSFGNVPSGTYYVRIRAVNAIGASIVSNERILFVP